jgi:hypothetical protein
MNNCPRCGLIQGLHFSVLPACKCQWQGTPNTDYQNKWVGNPKPCKCTDAKPVWDASAPLVMTPNPAFAKREWVGLTNEEIDKIRNTLVLMPREDRAKFSIYTYARAIEAKLKEKNT